METAKKKNKFLSVLPEIRKKIKKHESLLQLAAFASNWVTGNARKLNHKREMSE